MFESPFERLRPRVVIWAATLAVFLSSVVGLSLSQSGSVAGASNVSTTTRSIPTHLSIPAIGVSTNLTQLGLLANGSPQVPTSWYTAGWYKLGPAPGQLGSSVILGHVDSVSGPAVFYRLVDMKVGELVNVKLADGATVSFSVIAIRQYLKASFPDKLVYNFSTSYPALNLVTCGGSFDSHTGHYLSSIVVFTKEVTPT